MAQQITNDADLVRELNNKIKQAVKYAVDEIYDKNELIIQTIVYNQYDPTEYQRTWEFGSKPWRKEVNSTLGTEHGNVSGKMSYDTNLSEHKINDSFNQHMGFQEQSMKDYLADIIYQGLAGDFTGEYKYAKDNPKFKGEAWAQKRDAWKKLNDWLTITQIKKLFEEGMNRAGLQYTRHKFGIRVEKHD